MAIIQECGQCGEYHEPNWLGDCRDDVHRFTGAEDYAKRKGIVPECVEEENLIDSIEEADAIKQRLEYLRGELRAERISYGEINELMGLAEHIEPGDVELLEAAGVAEFPEDEPAYTVDMYPPADPAEVWRRWNCHAELLAALTLTIDTLEWAKKDGGPNYQRACEDLTAFDNNPLRAAIAKAVGGL